MKRAIFTLIIITLLVLAACASPATDTGTQPSVSDQVATVVGMTLQASTPEAAVAPTQTNLPEEPASLLPHSLYFLGKDGNWVNQVFRMERDGKTNAQLTSEPAGVDDYDVSSNDGSIAYITNNQLIMSQTDGSNRRELVFGGPKDGNNPWVGNPVFSPDGKIL